MIRRWKLCEKSPDSSRAVGVVMLMSAKSRYRQPSYDPKKNVRPLKMGPPKLAPNCDWRYSGCLLTCESLNGFRAAKFSLRKYPNVEPPKRFEPDFVVMFTTPPVTPPNSALSLCAWTLNSWRESISGSAT